MNTEQERAEFEAWYQHHHGDRDVYALDEFGEYADKRVQSAFNVWQARAALQPQKPKGNDIMLSGVIRMPFEMAMADPISRMQFYQRAQQALNELEALQSQDRADALRYRWIRQMIFDDRIIVEPDRMLHGEALDKAIDHARRIEGDT